VNDAGPGRILPASDAPIQQRVHERPRSFTGAGVYDETGGLVHHQEVLVLEDHGDGNILGLGALVDEPGLDALTAADLAGRGGCFVAVEAYQTVFDHAPRRTPAHVEALGDQAIQPLPGLPRFDLEVVTRVVQREPRPSKEGTEAGPNLLRPRAAYEYGLVPAGRAAYHANVAFGDVKEYG
jgi:hypothetical protein